MLNLENLTNRDGEGALKACTLAAAMKTSNKTSPKASILRIYGGRLLIGGGGQDRINIIIGKNGSIRMKDGVSD